jgi:hypothetical protein
VRTLCRVNVDLASHSGFDTGVLLGAIRRLEAKQMFGAIFVALELAESQTART